MIIYAFIGTICMIVQMAIAPQIESTFWCMAVKLLAAIGFLVALNIAIDREKKLEARIDALEDKLSEKENKK